MARRFALGAPLIAIAMTGRFDLEVGDRTRALTAYQRVQTRLGNVPLDRRGLATLAAALELALAFGDRADASRVLEQLEPFGASMVAGSLGAVGPMPYFIAHAKLVEGDHEAAVSGAEAAIAMCAYGGFGPWLARSRALHAEALLARGNAGDRLPAQRSLQLAHATATQLGMAPLVSRVAALQSVASGRQLLSSREMEVAALVARGLTNREIAIELTLSERTIEAHIQNTLNKLDFHSRTEIATWVVRHGLAGEAGEPI